MDQVLYYIERYKFAILGTIVFHVVVFITTNFTTLKRPFDMDEVILQADMPFDEIALDPEIMELLEIEPLPDNQGVPENVTNAAADENDSRQESYENFSTSEIDEQVESDAKSLEQQYFNEWANSHGNDGSSADIREEQEYVTDVNNRKPDNTIDKGGNTKAAGEVLVSFNLKDRKPHSLPKPGYTCDRSGTVKIDIKVDQNGEVKSASFNASGSKNADECMIQQAIKFAKKSRFNYSSSAPSSQSGTITYRFVG